MQIKREFEMTTRASRRFIIRQSPTENISIPCARCGEPMIEAEQAAKFFGVNQRRIFQIIETGMIHFLETDMGTTMICIASMAGESEKTRSVSLEVSDGSRDQQKERISDSK